MRIAVDRDFKNQDTGERETDFFDIVAWRKLAEIAAQYYQKGSLVSVDGRLRARQWVAQDGTKRSSVEIEAENMNSIGGRRDGDGGGGQGYHAEEHSHQSHQSAPPVRSQQPSAAVNSDPLDEIDPFADE
jgi:single-strand DNA-binding protein